MPILKRQNFNNDALLRQVFFVAAVFLIGWLFWSFLYTSPESLADYSTTGRVYPESDFVAGGFNSCAGSGCPSHAAVLDEVSYDFTDYIFDNDGGGNEVEEFEMTSVAEPNKQISEVEVNFRTVLPSGCVGNGSSCDQIEVSIFIDGAYYGPQTITLPVTDTLHSVVFTPPLAATCGGIPNRWCGDSDLRVQLTRRIRGTGSPTSDTVRLTRVFADISFTQPNNPPSVTGVVTNPPGPNPIVDQGDTITFEVAWSDPNGDSARAIVCKTNSVVGGSNPGCPGDAWAGPSPISASTPIILNYKTTSNDVGLNNFYAFVCDSPGGECSAAPPLLPIPSPASGTFTVDAATAELYGWGWSENVGWISFDAADCDTDENGFIDSGLCEGDNLTDQVFDYGVFLYTPTGDLSGFAWSSNIGWITFNRADAGNPPEAPFNGGSGPIARLEGPNLRGWARALSNGGGWDGWVRLDEDTSGGAPAYSAVTFNGTTEEFEGWAWGDDVMGWMSFNSTTDTASTIPYAVRSTPFNAAPSATNPDVSFSSSAGPVCTSQMRFSWDFQDPEDGDSCTDPDSLCGYRLQISTTQDAWTPAVEPMPPGVIQFDSGIVRSGAEERFVTIANPASGEYADLLADGDGTLAFNTAYYWRIQVFDSEGEPSDWYTYQNNAIPGEFFRTSLHAYPEPDFDWTCTDDFDNPNPNCTVPARIQFNDLTTFYGPASWQWQFPAAMTCLNPGIGCDVVQNPRVQLFSTGLYQVRLTATDTQLAADPNSGSGQCSRTQIVMGQYPLPSEFKEVTPVGYFRGLMDRLYSVINITNINPLFAEKNYESK